MSDGEKHQSGALQKFVSTILVSYVNMALKPGRCECDVSPVTTYVCNAEPLELAQRRVRLIEVGLIACFANVLGVVKEHLGQDFVKKSCDGGSGANVGLAWSEDLLGSRLVYPERRHLYR